MFKKLNDFKFILTIIAIILVVLTFGDYFPESVKITANTLSLIIRNCLVFFIPVLVLPYLVTGIARLQSRGVALVFSLVFLIALSNFISICMGGAIANYFVSYMSLKTVFNAGDAHQLGTWFNLELKPFVSIEMVLAFGFGMALYLVLFPQEKILNFFKGYEKISTAIFKNILIPALPIYIFGTLLQLDAENDFATVFSDFGAIILIIVATQISYIFFVFWVGNKFSLSRALWCWKNALPAWLFGFSTMSSLMTMPMTLEATEKNIEDKDLAHIAIPTTVNSHVIGDCISLPIIAMSIYLIANGMVFPDLGSFLHFAVILTLAQFTAVAVPGGSVVVLIPVLISHYGFTTEMIGLLTTLSIFMDAMSTSHNVLGNCAFALIIKRYFGFLDKVFPKRKKA